MTALLCPGDTHGLPLCGRPPSLPHELAPAQFHSKRSPSLAADMPRESQQVTSALPRHAEETRSMVLHCRRPCRNEWCRVLGHRQRRDAYSACRWVSLQAVFHGMCCGGRMFGWRRWHVKVNQNQCRFSVVSAFTAFLLHGLVLAHGRAIEKESCRRCRLARPGESPRQRRQLWQRRLALRERRRPLWPRGPLRACARTTSTPWCVRCYLSRARTTFTFFCLPPNYFAL
ncbi:hypothetical protein DFH11DRAFT_1879939 [Phellopilus nigrolimitatus]|nr:hypothetical protein DFH11DRAFT_1879939 [Phellopilus nigrolimitatus]